MSTFGQRLQKSRKKAKLTQEQVANKLGLDYSTISKYENDHSQPDNDTLIVLADLYLVTVDYLLGRSVEQSDHDLSLVDAYLPKEKLEKLTPKQMEKINDFLSLPEDIQMNIGTMIEAAVEIVKNKNRPD
ncbi:helix-turn-helix domain-containing protein [Brevibacillus laterosporus]|uniref:XRE family transcriptional regulator n=2 Tax=Brevibacillus TaxID=55080 RepID=A0A0F6Y002_BRELA|nr:MULTISPECIES: helix-turn-helix domain-containing protein [Brevibacillus]AKF94671.1 XRE family transcriptional regulator [Brevibacillus laterosporus]MCR8983565.1 helix-turn-helix domain-containing protein [Brevibacillus laterosporus]MCZ0829283.1 helix-turn-helix domain-containing protein [Brevibacillus halotolerans]GIO00614.1 transcriptional regulator [Brevibacillus halotolerans]